MAGRLSPDARRAQIIAVTRRLIAEHGPSGLSMRAIARACDMTGPGIAHHFPTLGDLLMTVMSERDHEYAAAILEEVRAHGEDMSLLLAVDTMVRYYAQRPRETRNFQLLLAAAMDPAHPAHPYVAHRPRGRELTVPLAERDYVDPVGVMNVLSLVIDGLNSRWFIAPEMPDMWADWQAVRRPLFNGFVRKDGRLTIPDPPAA